jgi:hypothetical protein
MKERCINPNIRQYDNYGGRGITVTDRWRGAEGFINFLADMGERPEGRGRGGYLSLDRIDNDGNYEPGNCRWATSHEQALNRQRVHNCPDCRHVR